MPKFDKLKNDSAPSAEAPPQRSALETRLDEVTATIAYQDRLEKSAKAAKEDARAEFFRLADALLESQQLDRIKVPIPDYVHAGGRFTVAEWAERDYPAWRFIKADWTEDAYAILEHDPSKMPFSWVNNSLGLVFARQISMVKSGIDFEWLTEEHPEIAKAVLTPVTEYVFSDEAAHIYLNEHPESQSVFERVVYPGQTQVKLAAPRKIKEDNDE